MTSYYYYYEFALRDDAFVLDPGSHKGRALHTLQVQLTDRNALK
jgi:hypothetical protein